MATLGFVLRGPDKNLSVLKEAHKCIFLSTSPGGLRSQIYRSGTSHLIFPPPTQNSESGNLLASCRIANLAKLLGVAFHKLLGIAIGPIMYGTTLFIFFPGIHQEREKKS